MGVIIPNKDVTLDCGHRSYSVHTFFCGEVSMSQEENLWAESSSFNNIKIIDLEFVFEP